MSFELRPPQRTPVPVIVEVPHAGLVVEADAMPWLVAPVRAVGRDADLYVDRLASEAPALGATLLLAKYSRYVCDLNRSPTDVDRLGVVGATGVGAPHGFIWRATSDGQPALSSPLPQLEHGRRVRELWTPYHEQLRALLGEMRQKFGYAILLSLHSMPSRGRPGTAEADQLRADIVPGTRGRSTAHPTVITVAEEVAAQFGWSLRHDDPYRGGYTTAQYGHPSQGIHAIQIELSRGRYLDEQRLTLLPHWVQTRQLCSELVLHLSRLSAASLSVTSAKTPG